MPPLPPLLQPILDRTTSLLRCLLGGSTTKVSMHRSILFLRLQHLSLCLSQTLRLRLLCLSQRPSLRLRSVADSATADLRASGGSCLLRRLHLPVRLLCPLQSRLHSPLLCALLHRTQPSGTPLLKRSTMPT